MEYACTKLTAVTAVRLVLWLSMSSMFGVCNHCFGEAESIPLVLLGSTLMRTNAGMKQGATSATCTVSANHNVGW
jgi:hypothetical protein